MGNRKENDIFIELETLCQSPGYVHAIAYFCFRDNTVQYTDEITVENVLKQYSDDRLLRTEISILIGLMCKHTINDNLPEPTVLQRYIDDTERLLK